MMTKKCRHISAGGVTWSMDGPLACGYVGCMIAVPEASGSLSESVGYGETNLLETDEGAGNARTRNRLTDAESQHANQTLILKS